MATQIKTRLVFMLIILLVENPPLSSGCFMKLLGSTYQVDDGLQIAQYSTTFKEECFYFCLATATCISVEYNSGSGSCKLFSKVDSIYSLGNQFYEMYDKECSDGQFEGVFKRKSTTLEYVPISSSTTTKLRCSLKCMVDKDCSVFVYDNVSRICSMYVETSLGMGTSLCDGTTACFVKN